MKKKSESETRLDEKDYIERNTRDFAHRIEQYIGKLKTGHKRAVSRREFLGHGLLTGTVTLALPGMLNSMIARNIHAQGGNCPLPTVDTNRLKVFYFDGDGGWEMNSWVHPGLNEDPGQLLNVSAYTTKWGMSAAQAPTNGGVTRSIGGVPMRTDHPITQALVTRLGQPFVDNIRFLLFNARTPDDTRTQMNHMSFLTHGQGRVGEVAGLVGTNGNTFAGGKNELIIGAPNMQASVIGNNARSLAEVLSEANLDVTTKRLLGSQMAGITQRELNTIANSEMPPEVKQVVQCSYNNMNVALNRNPDELDPAQTQVNPQIRTIFNNLNNGQEARTATAALLVNDGFASGATIEFPGQDIHNQGSNTWINEMTEFGDLLAKTIDYTVRTKGNDFLAFICSDGSLSGVTDPATNQPNHSSDADSQSLAVAMYVPATLVPAQMNTLQYGSQTSVGGINLSYGFPGEDNPFNNGLYMAYEYCKLAGLTFEQANQFWQDFSGQQNNILTRQDWDTKGFAAINPG